MSNFCRPRGHLQLRDPKGGDRVISIYDYIRRGESSEKVSCSLGSNREQPSIKVVTVKFAESKGAVDIKSDFLLRAWFSFDEQ